MVGSFGKRKGLLEISCIICLKSFLNLIAAGMLILSNEFSMSLQLRTYSGMDADGVSFFRHRDFPRSIALSISVKTSSASIYSNPFIRSVLALRRSA